MKVRMRKIESICIIAALLFSMMIGNNVSVYATERDGENELISDTKKDTKTDFGDSSSEIKLTDIVSFERPSQNLFEITDSSKKLVADDSSSVVEYFKTEYTNALSMKGSSTNYYDIDVSSYSLNIDSTEFNTIRNIFCTDMFSDSYDTDYNTYEFKNPFRFHMAGNWDLLGDTETGVISIIRIYYSSNASSFKAYYSAICDFEEDIFSFFSNSMTVEEAILTIHDAMIRELNFAYDDYKNGKGANVLYHDSWGTMAGREGLCDGYAYAFKYFMDCITVDGVHLKSRVVYSENLNHMWNMIQVGGNWYHIDTAWDDLVVKSHNFTSTFSNVAEQVSMYGDYNPDYADEGYVSHAYFMKTDSEMKNYGYSNWVAYFPISNAVSKNLTPTSSNSFNRECTNVEGNMPYANGYWYIAPSSGSVKSFVKTKFNGTGKTTINTNYYVRYLQTDGSYLYYTDGQKLIRTDLNGNNVMISKVASDGQSISEFAIKNGKFVYMLISGNSVQRMNSEISSVSWSEECKHTYEWKVESPATFEQEGKMVNVCTKCGEVKDTSVIKKIGTVKLTSSSLTYNGKARKAGVKVVDSEGNSIGSTNYTLTYENNKNVGVAKVTVKFKGERYSGTKKLSYNIVPASTKITSAKGISKGFEIKWKQQKVQTSGYEIQFSTNKKFPSSSTKSTFVKKTSLTSGRARNLKAKKTYYIRIRTYKTVKSKKIYSSWSKVVSVKTKG